MKKVYSLLGILAVLAVGTLLFYTIENYRGQSAWNAYAQAQKAKGLDLLSPPSYPPPLPPEENFGESRLVQEILFSPPEKAGKVLQLTPVKRPPSFREEFTFAAGHLPDVRGLAEAYGKASLSEAIAPIKPQLDEIALYAKRKGLNHHARELSSSYRFHHINGLGLLMRFQNLRVLAALAEGDSQASYEGVDTALNLLHHLQPTPVMLSLMLEASYAPRIANDLWIGLATHLWDEKQLAHLQARLEKINLIDQLNQSFRNEQVLFLSLVDDPRFVPDHFPKGWVHQNRLNFSQVFDTFLPKVMDPSARTLSRDEVDRFSASLSEEKPWRPYHFLADRIIRQHMESLDLIFSRVAFAQTSLHFAILGCALERYRLVHGDYPETLEALLPDFCKTVPQEVIARGPLSYRKLPDGGYLLYSVGWNQQDDGGTLAFSTEGKPDPTAGDWIWKMPAKVSWEEE